MNFKEVRAHLDTIPMTAMLAQAAIESFIDNMHKAVEIGHVVDGYPLMDGIKHTTVVMSSALAAELAAYNRRAGNEDLTDLCCGILRECFDKDTVEEVMGEVLKAKADAASK